MDFYRRFGRRLSEARRAAGLSQADLAVAIKLTRPSVSNIEQGRQKVLLHTFGKILAVLNVQPTELLPDSHARSTPPPGWHSLAHDERDFIQRGLHRFKEETHAKALDTNPENPEYGKGTSETV
ncbi:MAG: helix-turn-helix transcriptional regulator [Bryobacterales bacterium]|nr:helix-turn-helix transcriptional regulator [Bryobacterales bacterium]